MQKHSTQKKSLRITAAAFGLIALAIGGCGSGGGSSHQAQTSTGGNNSSSVQGVATPSNLSVVTAQNANAGS